MNGMPLLRHSWVWRSIASGSSAPMSTRSRSHCEWIGPSSIIRASAIAPA